MKNTKEADSRTGRRSNNSSWPSCLRGEKNSGLRRGYAPGSGPQVAVHVDGVVTGTSAQARFSGSPLAPGCIKHTVTTVVAPAGRPVIGITSSANLARPEPTQSVVATVPTLAKVWPPSTETRIAAAALTMGFAALNPSYERSIGPWGFNPFDIFR